jgi:DNA-binding transcriptional ArsR family regulator
MKLELVAKAMKELGHVTRLSIFKRVVKVGFKGISMGELQQELAVPGSTLSHHVSALVNAGLIAQRREGRTLFCVAEYDTLADVINFLETECCVDEIDE